MLLRLFRMLELFKFRFSQIKLCYTYHCGMFPNTISVVYKLGVLIINLMIIGGDNYKFLFVITLVCHLGSGKVYLVTKVLLSMMRIWSLRLLPL